MIWVMWNPKVDLGSLICLGNIWRWVGCVGNVGCVAVAVAVAALINDVRHTSNLRVILCMLSTENEDIIWYLRRHVLGQRERRGRGEDNYLVPSTPPRTSYAMHKKQHQIHQAKHSPRSYCVGPREKRKGRKVSWGRRDGETER